MGLSMWACEWMATGKWLGNEIHHSGLVFATYLPLIISISPWSCLWLTLCFTLTAVRQVCPSPTGPWTQLSSKLEHAQKSGTCPRYQPLLGISWPQRNTFLSDLTSIFPCLLSFPFKETAYVCWPLLYAMKEEPFLFDINTLKDLWGGLVLPIAIVFLSN